VKGILDIERACREASKNSPSPGSDVMIFKIFSPKLSAKKIGVFDSKQG
jgi:hypothetical protein